MATENYQPIGVKTERFNWGDIHTGTAAALIEAKIVAECDLPGQPGNNRLSVTRGVNREPGSKQTRRYPRKRGPDVFAVRIDASFEEQNRRIAAEDAVLRESQEAERATAKSARIAEGTLLLLPNTPDEYRQKLVEDWDMHARIIRANALPKKGNGTDVYSMAANGFRLGDSDIEKFDELASEIRTLLMNAGVRFNAKRQSEIVSNCNAAIARGDSKFQRVLASCIE